MVHGCSILEGDGDINARDSVTSKSEASERMVVEDDEGERVRMMGGPSGYLSSGWAMTTEPLGEQL